MRCAYETQQRARLGIRADRYAAAGVMNSPITRRAALTAPLVLAGCRRRDPYFGKSTPPKRESLVYEVAGEPSGFDPATNGDASEFYVMSALFEGVIIDSERTSRPANHRRPLLLGCRATGSRLASSRRFSNAQSSLKEFAALSHCGRSGAFGTFSFSAARDFVLRLSRQQFRCPVILV